ncbi:MAG: ABC transporter ATP-binding protein/permease [Clostridiales bacterium]|nr:ABC transporter ATP-binding protein/permease [Clostridiales bacterium]
MKEQPPKTAKGQKPKTGAARLLQLAGGQKPLIVTSMALAVLSAVAAFVPFLAVFYVVREALAHIRDLSAADTGLMTAWGAVALGGVAANVLVYFAALMCSHLAAFRTQYSLKKKYMRHLSDMPLGFHTVTPSGKIRKIVDENIERLEGFVAHSIPDLAASIAAPIVMVASLFAFDYRFGLAALLPILIVLVFQSGYMGTKNAKRLMAQWQNAMEDMNAGAVEYVRGISVVKAFNQTIFSFRKFREKIKAFTSLSLHYTLNWKTVYAVFQVIINNIYLFIVPVGILIGNAAGAIGPEYNAFALSFLFYLILAPSLGALLLKVMYVSRSGQIVSDGIERMDKILAVKPLPDAAAPKKPGNYTVEFDDVCFSYDADGAETLKNVSFAAPQGKITALVGASGSGKSTIAHLIPRFWDVASGGIKIGGVDVRDVAQGDLMDTVGFVFQDVFLFKESVFDNIAEGRPGVSRERAVEAAKAAQCHNFIEKLPNGYDTVIGGDGVHLSGGERQRLVLARAIVKDAPIIVLDEATAFADPENERLIQSALEKLIKGKTVVVIAHRLSTVRNADQIVVVDGGEIVQKGTHAELLAGGGRYAAMWDSYTAALDWRIEGGEGRGKM